MPLFSDVPSASWPLNGTAVRHAEMDTHCGVTATMSAHMHRTCSRDLDLVSTLALIARVSQSNDGPNYSHHASGPTFKERIWTWGGDSRSKRIGIFLYTTLKYRGDTHTSLTGVTEYSKMKELGEGVCCDVSNPMPPATCL